MATKFRSFIVEHRQISRDLAPTVYVGIFSSRFIRSNRTFLNPPPNTTVYNTFIFAGCFTCSMESGFRVYNVEPLTEKLHQGKFTFTSSQSNFAEQKLDLSLHTVIVLCYDPSCRCRTCWQCCTHRVVTHCNCSMLLPQHVPLSSKIDQLSHLESTTVSRATPLCVLCMS